MKNEEISRVLVESAREGYSFNQSVTFGYPFKKMSKIAQVQCNPDDNLSRIYHIILQLVKIGYSRSTSLLAFLGSSENDDFLQKEIHLLVWQGLLESSDGELSVTEMGELYLKGNYSIMVENTMRYDYLLDTVSGEIFSCNNLQAETQKEPLKSIKPSPEIFNNKKISSLKANEIKETFHHDFKNQVLLLDFIGDLPHHENIWAKYVLAEYTCNDDDCNIPPYYTVRSAADMSLNKKLTAKFNTSFSKYIPSLLY